VRRPLADVPAVDAEQQAAFYSGVQQAQRTLPPHAEQDVIPCAEGNRDSEVVLTPSTPLTAGEYAIVLVPAHSMATGTFLTHFLGESGEATRFCEASHVGN